MKESYRTTEDTTDNHHRKKGRRLPSVSPVQPGPHPWERQPEESGKAYRAFVTYRDLGLDRTLERAAADCGKHVSLLRRWSARYGWRLRVLAWDDEQAREMDAALRQRRRAAYERQARDAEQLQRLGMARLASVVKRDPATGEPALDENISARDAMAAYKLGLEIQRALESAPEKRVEQDGEHLAQEELRRMSNEQLMELLALLKERGQETEDDDDQADEQHTQQEG